MPMSARSTRRSWRPTCMRSACWPRAFPGKWRQRGLRAESGFPPEDTTRQMGSRSRREIFEFEDFEFGDQRSDAVRMPKVTVETKTIAVPLNFLVVMPGCGSLVNVITTVAAGLRMKGARLR